MSSSSRDSGKLGGLVWILFGGVFLAGAIPISRPPTVTDTDPGPRALPLVLSITLIAGGLLEFCYGYWQCRQSASSITSANDHGRTAPPHNHTRMAFLFFAGLWLFVPAVSLAGFIPTTLVMATLGMWGLGSRLRTAIPVAVALVICIHVLFGMIFHVLLPTGQLWG